MKSERGQTQESNLLADRIDAQLGVIKQYLPVIGGVAAVAVVALLIYGTYTTQLTGRAARAWTDWYFEDTSATSLDVLAKDMSDTTAGAWASVIAGDSYMSKATDNWVRSNELAKQFYKQAADEYREATNKAKDSFIKSRAHFGLAQAAEGLGSREEAIAEYRKVASTSGIAPEFLAEVNNRIKWLESKDGEAFFAWYKELPPTVSESAPGPSSMPSLPGLPNMTFPGLGGGSDTPEAVAPAPATDTPAADTPAADAPASATPTTPVETPAEAPKP